MDKRECKNCKYKLDCKLYLSEFWFGDSEAESCRSYKED